VGSAVTRDKAAGELSGSGGEVGGRGGGSWAWGVSA